MELLTLHYKNRILKHQHLRQVKKYASLFLFFSLGVRTVFLLYCEKSNFKQKISIELINRKLKAHEMNMSPKGT